MAVLVKATGPPGDAYVAAIGPFRCLGAYPAMPAQLERTPREAASDPPPVLAGKRRRDRLDTVAPAAEGSP